MFIGKIVEELSTLALRNSAVGDQLAPFTAAGAEGVLTDYVADALLAHTNSAVRNIYSRFPLKEKELYLGCISGQSTYLLNLEQVEAGTAGQYILDETYASEVGPFVEDVVQIVSIHNVTTDKDVVLNQEGNSESILAPDSVNIRVPNSISKDSPILRIRYTALPTSGITADGALPGSDIVSGGGDGLSRLQGSLPWAGVQTGVNMWSDSKSWVPVPEQFVTAIANYICYKILYQADRLQENTDAVFYMNAYENECRLLKSAGLFDDTDYASESDDKMLDNGWE